MLVLSLGDPLNIHILVEEKPAGLRQRQVMFYFNLQGFVHLCPNEIPSLIYVFLIADPNTESRIPLVKGLSIYICTKR